jgi:DNA repair protein RecN (Recombination protein N)
VATTHERVRALERRLDELRELAGARERELDLVIFELEEIEAAAPSEEEETELEEERQRLRHLEALRSAAAAGVEALSPESGEGAVEALAAAAAQLEPVAGFDPQLRPLSERLSALRYEAEELGAELKRYLMGIEASPGRLEEVEERLAVLDRLKRKHGGAISEVLAHAERCRARRDELQRADAALEETQAEYEMARGERDAIASELTQARRSAAPRLAAGVRERLAQLAMADASFDVEVEPREGGCGPRGADSVELTIAPNPGMSAGPLRDIASGGELSRVMLALLSEAHGGAQDATPLLVFDEIDAGIGGHTARAVGEHLRQLAEGRQILCITHLPQVAALAARHFTIEKDSTVTPARTEVTALDGDQVVGEIVRMLGAGDDDRAASDHARKLLQAA